MESRMIEKPAISVIVPVFNAEKTLPACLDSLLAQTFKNYEIIIVDDGSTDATASICDKYAEEHCGINVIHLKKSGVSAARNAGLGQAEGEWITFCDADDTVCEYWLSSMHAAAADAGMVVCGYNHYRLDKPGEHPVQRTLGHSARFTEVDELLENLISRRLFQNIWNKMFERKVIVENHLTFKEGFDIFEDEYFVLEYLPKISSVVCVPECAYNYFAPADFVRKYDFGIDVFQEVVGKLYEAVAYIPGRIRLPSIVRWYNMALIRFATLHSYKETLPRIKFARELAATFRGGSYHFLWIRCLPSFLVYPVLKTKSRKVFEL